MHTALGRQLGRNAKAYIDDIVVKSREASTLIQDLEETFTSLRQVDLRLNPKKCVRGPLRQAAGLIGVAQRDRG